MISSSKRDTLYPERDGDEVPADTGVYRRASVRERQGGEHYGELAGWRVRLVTDDPVELAISLIGFRSALMLRYAAEEADNGLLSEIHRRYDDAELIASLRAEHEEILAAGEDLARRICRTETKLGELEARMRDALIARIGHHEWQERALLGAPQSGVREVGVRPPR